MKLENAKVWLYQMQQRLAITRSEATALLALAALLTAGMVVRYVQGSPRAVPGSERAATDHRFQKGVARLRALQKEGASAQEASPQEGGRSTAADHSPAARGAEKMNLNEASAQQLERLPRVGPVIASRIVAYREAHGPFAEVAHLERVSGIGPKTMERLTPLLIVAPPREETP